MKTTEPRTAQATAASRVTFARRRFEKARAEMEAWGCTVIIPEVLTPPNGEKTGQNS